MEVPLGIARMELLCLWNWYALDKYFKLRHFPPTGLPIGPNAERSSKLTQDAITLTEWTQGSG